MSPNDVNRRGRVLSCSASLLHMQIAPQNIGCLILAPNIACAVSTQHGSRLWLIAALVCLARDTVRHGLSYQIVLRW